MSTLFDVEVNETPDLPPLEGSERQIGWALVIRAGKLKHIDKLLSEWQRFISNLKERGLVDRYEAERRKLRAALDAAEQLQSETSAAFWIDHRDNTARELVDGAEAKPGTQMRGFRL